MTTVKHLQINTFQTMKGSNFIFHLFDDKDGVRIALSSDYVYPPTNKDELKELADFIYKYLENK